MVFSLARLAVPLAAASSLVAAPAWAAPPGRSAPPPAAAAPDAAAPMPDLSRLAWRHSHLTLHQGFGLATLGGMAATGTMGLLLAQQPSLYEGHLLAGALTTGLYATTATLALTAPPRPITRRRNPWDTVALHEQMRWVHAAGLAGTIGLGLLTVYGGDNAAYRPIHGIVGLTTLGAMGLSAAVVAFGE